MHPLDKLALVGPGRLGAALAAASPEASRTAEGPTAFTAAVAGATC